MQVIEVNFVDGAGDAAGEHHSLAAEFSFSHLELFEYRQGSLLHGWLMGHVALTRIRDEVACLLTALDHDARCTFELNKNFSIEHEHFKPICVDPTEAIMSKSKADRTEGLLEFERLRAMHQETTDPMAARLLGDILTEMEAVFGVDQKTARDDDSAR
jgi:hypothetical protein